MSEQPQHPGGRRSARERIQEIRRSLLSFWTDEAVLIYRRSAQGKHRFRIHAIGGFLFLREVVRESLRNQILTRAASLAYTTLLSLVPLVVAFSYVIRNYFARLFPDFRAQLDTILNLIVPYRSGEIAYHINRFAQNAETASTFGAVVFLLISFELFMAVEDTVNKIWKVPKARGYRQKLRAFTMLLFWGPLLIGLSFTTTSSLQKSPYVSRYVSSDLVLTLLPLLMLFVAFTMLFWLVPATSATFKAAVLGSAITSILFELVRSAFGWYTARLFAGRLNIIYGTLGLLIVFLVALELMWVIVLLGVEISFVFQNLRGVLRASELQLHEDPRYDTYFALRSLVEITRRFEMREDAPSSYRLAEVFGATDRQMMNVLRRLEDQQLVKEIGGDWEGFVPGFDPDKISVEEVLRVMEGGNRELPLTGDEDRVKESIARLFSAFDDCVVKTLGAVTITQLVREVHGPQRPPAAEDDVRRFRP
ncbi:MAG: YihY family inner membrane protein [Thermoanaerobaculia bacterium]